MQRPCLLILTALAGLFLVGCGPGENAGKKIDVAAQLAGLKGDNDAKAAALAELAAGGPKSAPVVSEITVLLKDSDPVLRRLAAYALGQIGPAAKSAVPDLKRLLEDRDSNAVTAAVNALRVIDLRSLPAEFQSNPTQ